MVGQLKQFMKAYITLINPKRVYEWVDKVHKLFLRVYYSTFTFYSIYEARVPFRGFPKVPDSKAFYLVSDMFLKVRKPMIGNPFRVSDNNKFGNPIWVFSDTDFF